MGKATCWNWVTRVVVVGKRRDGMVVVRWEIVESGNPMLGSHWQRLIA